MNCGVALTPNLSVSSSTILPMENQRADLRRCRKLLVTVGRVSSDVLPLLKPALHSRPCSERGVVMKAGGVVKISEGILCYKHAPRVPYSDIIRPSTLGIGTSFCGVRYACYVLH